MTLLYPSFLWLFLPLITLFLGKRKKDLITTVHLIVLSSEGVVLPLVGLFVMIALSVIFSLLYYQKIEKPVYKKAIGYGKIS